MAKSQRDPSDSAASEAETVVAETPSKRFRVRTRSESGPEKIVEAETPEDAVRAFNGNSTNYPFKLLIVEPA